VSESFAVVESAVGSRSKRSRLWFAMSGLFGGLALGGVISVIEYLIRWRDIHQVALLTYGILYPLVGFGLGELVSRYPHSHHWVRPPNFFSVEPLPATEAAERGARTRRFVWTGFATGMIVALLAAGLDYAWRGWPFLAATLVGGLLWCPYMGLLLGYNLSLRPGASKPSIRNMRFRMRTLMIMVAYAAILFGLGSQVSRYSQLANQYLAKAMNARQMIVVFQGELDKSRADVKRADNAKALRARRIPDGLLPSQKDFLKGLEGKNPEEFIRYRYGLIADGEDRAALSARQNVDTYNKLVDHYKKLVEKYLKAVQKPWLPVEPDPPMPR
jgi:hypothetical protein